MLWYYWIKMVWTYSFGISNTKLHGYYTKIWILFTEGIIPLNTCQSKPYIRVTKFIDNIKWVSFAPIKAETNMDAMFIKVNY